MMKLFFVGIIALAVTTLCSTAGTTHEVDINSVLRPIRTAYMDDMVQDNHFAQPYYVQIDAANSVFAASYQHLLVHNVPVPPYGTATLALEATRPVFDARSTILIATKNGKVPLKVRPVYSYKGQIVGEPGSSVSLHYSTDGDITGFITHANGERTVVGKAPEYRAGTNEIPHVFQAESAGALSPVLDNFICGSDELPFDAKEALEHMDMPTSQKGESVQAMVLKQLTLALVLREDVDSALKRQGLNDEQIVQHFAKIVAAMSQAYEQELGAHMYIGYMEVYTTEAPSGFLYDGKDPGKLLDEFSELWSGAYSSIDRVVAHLYTIKKPVQGMYVGGIAYGGQAGSRLCVKDHRGGYGVSTLDLRANETIPGAAANRNAFVWDVFVAAHEIGHNVGAPHGHSCYWSPPLDTCQLQSDGTDACYNNPALRRVRPGTIMSYCHLVNGSSTPLEFGTRASERMRTWIDASCMQAVTEPLVRITSPRGPDGWGGGDKLTILWASAMVNNVNLDYRMSDNGQWLSIASNLNAIDGKYVWTLPAQATNTLWIRIGDATNADVFNIAPAAYSIRVPLVISNPVGGERLAKGAKFQVRWTKDPSITTVNVLFSSDAGQNWETVASKVSASAYDWTVPDIETEQAMIRLEAAANTSITAVSPVFAIGTPRFKLLLPKEGSDLCNNFDNQFNWSADFIDRIRIRYSTDDGVTWRNAIQPLSVAAAQWQIFSRNAGMTSLDAGTKVSLRVEDASTDEVLDTRDELNIVSCTQVTSVNDDHRSAARIVDISPNPAQTTALVRITVPSASTATIKAVSVTGTEYVLVPAIQLHELENYVNVPLAVVPAGAYNLVIESKTTRTASPLRIVR